MSCLTIVTVGPLTLVATTNAKNMKTRGKNEEIKLIDLLFRRVNELTSVG